MKIGDLVQIQKWCRNKGELAVITRVGSCGDVQIEHLNPTITAGLDGKFKDHASSARVCNLILVSEA